MKDIKVKVLAELMKDSRASDRSLAQKLGVSQPTVSRVRDRMKRDGYIREYTLIPDFHKLGFQIMALTFVKLSRPLSKEEIDKLRKFADDLQEKAPFARIMTYEGMGHGYDRVIMTLHEDYTAYAKFLRNEKQNPIGHLYSFDSFIVDLASSSHYRPLTFSKLADYMLKLKK